ncbi:phosphoribosyltransferase-like protein [Pseudomonas nunensis]|uniref:phosphoribosyltransferase-like protein n=1 Tax=Pseudomonas nunensis TaxID=2961896 RepID=UPI0006B5467A|nr:hypothetical protein [Pseudomonas nunensis]KOY01763.1 hypothetical protein AM274_14370 [Pseudomonas nunensis]
MSFEVPPGKERFFIDTRQKIDLLVRKGVLNGIKKYELQRWLNNFEGDQGYYLAAHLLDALIYRSSDMLKSMRRHMLEMQLATKLQHSGYESPDCMVDFLKGLKNGDLALPLRFVAVDGDFEATPGKSGAVLVRDFRQDGLINKSIIIRPQDVLGLPDHIKWLVLVDDFVGTGSQAEKFFKYYDVAAWAKSRNVILLSFMAHAKGVKKITEEYPFVLFDCAEVLTSAHGFFSPSAASGLWSRDGYNSVEDVISFYRDALKLKGINYKHKKFDLDLAISFSRTIPNNTLKAYWSSQGTWCPLINRG